jgi:mRNA interferase RelE/StbE
MGRYRIVFRKSVAKDLRQIPRQDIRRILAAVDSLADEPRPPGMETLTGQDKCRLRQGNYRIIYEIKDDEISGVIVKIGHRKDVYRRR